MSCTERIISFDFDIVVKKTSQQWFGMVCTPIDNDICHYSGQKKKKILLSLRVQIKLNHGWFIKFYQGIPLWVNNSVIKESALVITADEYIGKVFSNSAIETTWQSKKR